jgi:hypothetical protein
LENLGMQQPGPARRRASIFDRWKRLVVKTADRARGFWWPEKSRIDFSGILPEKPGICAVIDVMILGYQ